MGDTPGTEYQPVSVECTVTARAGDASNYDRNAPPGWRTVPPGPIAEFVAAVVEGMGERGMRAVRAIAEDEQYGAIHLVRLVCAAELAAHTFGSVGLLAGDTHGALLGRFVTDYASPQGLPDLLAALRSEGLCGATDVAKQMTVEQRIGVLDALSHYVCTFTREALWDPEYTFEAGGDR